VDAQTALPDLSYYRPTAPAPSPRVIEADVCIYGGTSAAVAAAVQLRRMGRTAVIAEFGRHIGGLTAGGLGATDIGNKAAIGGISRDFYRRLGRYYADRKIAIPTRGQQKVEGDAAKWDSGPEEAWVFEPSAAAKVFADLLADAQAQVHYEQHLLAVRKDRGRIRQIEMADGTIYRATVFIDATYEGDLMAMAGVTYHVGREANAVYDETLNGVHFGHPNHNFTRFVDPYVVPGDPASGLLKGIFPGDGGRQGDGDHRVQAYNFRMCLTQRPDIRVAFPKPTGYDPARYELLLRYVLAGVHDSLNLTVMMPNGKTDTNNYGAFSSDNIGMNYAWPDGVVAARSDASVGPAVPAVSGRKAGVRTAAMLAHAMPPLDLYALRERIFQDHVNYQAGLYWFLANDPRVPQAVRDHVSSYGLAADEFTATSHWPHQLYVREARRMISQVVMTEHHCVGRFVAEDPVGLAAYTMDSHNCNRVVRGGRAMNEGNVEVGRFPPYPISWRSIVPRQRECANLLVPVCLSASHIAYGSIRMEPVFMILGQSAATAAAMAIEHKCAVQQVDYPTLRAKLLADGQVLEWKRSA